MYRKQDSSFSLPSLSTVEYFSGHLLFISYWTVIEYACINTRKSIRGKLHHCQRPKMWRTWRVFSITAENIPHAHHKTHLHAINVYNTRPVYSITIEVLTEVFTCSWKKSTLSSDRIRGPTRSGKARHLSRQSFLNFLQQIKHGAASGTPGTMIPQKKKKRTEKETLAEAIPGD